ncbi:MAG TPA: carotenoid oxygenase family protein [Acidimicrobiales bacterium]|nr:carotenoid oxygenase family protein [Acidimicrobiales bacterium]
MGGIWERRAVLRALGLGTAGLSLGGLGLVAGCGGDGDDRAGGHGTGRRGATGPDPAVRPYDPDRPYWEQGNFAAVTTEETVTDLAVTGTIPGELSGLFVRNGSNPPTGTSLHWFLGDGMVHGVRLEGGKAAWYRNRYVRTPLAEAGKDLLTFGGPPGKANNQSNVSAVHHAGKLLTLGEVGWPFELSTADLSTVGPWDFAGRLGETMTAHPKIDPGTGRLHFFGYELLRPALTYYAADPAGRVDVVSPIAVDATSMIHDFAITDRDAVFWIGPVLFGGDPGNPYPDIPVHWDPTGPCRVGVMPLDGGGDTIRWVDVPPCFVFHGLAAHRDGDDVVLRVHRLAEAFGRQGDLVPSFLTEWRIGTGGPALTFAERRLSDRPMDLPAHDRRHTGREVRHGWCTTTTPADAEHGFELLGICHVDLRTGDEDVWDPGDGLRGGEPVFVPGGDREGEGWLLTYVWDRTTDRSALAVFDAGAVADGPVGRVELPVRVPFGFHGLWVDEARL